MTTILPTTRPLTPLSKRTAPSPPAVDQRSARRRRAQRGVVASYLHDISARHTQVAPAV